MAVITTLQDSNIDNVNNMFIGLSGTTTAASRYSRDGKIWTAGTAPADIAWYAMTYGNDIAVGVATNANGAACNSTIDGITYIARTIPAAGSGRGWYATQFGAIGDGIFVALTGGSATGTIAASSIDGITWTPRTCQTGDWRAIDYGNGRFVAVDYGNTTSQYSTDGITWNTGGTMPCRANWISVAYSMVSGTPTFVAIANGPRVVDFITATTLAFNVSKTITRAAGNFTTDGFVTGTTFTITGSTSNNGTYTVNTVGTTTMTVLETMVTEAASATEVITPTSYNAAYSTDGGANWTGTYMPSYTNWRSVCTNGAGKFVAVSSTSDTKAAVSTNGISWSASTLPVAAVWNNVCYGNGIFLASSAGSTNSAVSTDGTNWVLWAQVSATWNAVIWAPFGWRSNDTLTIQNGNTITVNTNQTKFWSGMTINNGTLRITNTSTTTPIRFTTGRTSGAAAGTITVANGLGLIDVVGNWITLATTGDGTSNQEMTIPYTDYVPCLWVEKTANAGDWEIWLNVTGVYAGSLKTYADGILDVSTGQRGKFFTQKPNTTQDQVISLTDSTTVIGSRTILVSDVSGIYPGATITGTGIPAGSVVEQVISSGNKLIINLAATAANTNTTVTIYNPGVSQFLPTVVFGDNVHGNKLPTGAHVKLPNIMITNDTAANLMTASSVVGTAIVTAGGARVSLDTCLFDDAYSNFTQAQSLAITNVGMTYPPLLVEIYDLEVDGLGLGMPPSKRCYTTFWTNREARYTLSSASVGLLHLSYVSNATFNNLAIVCQSPNAVTAGAITGATSMINIGFSDNVTLANVRLYALNAIRAYNVGIFLLSYVTNSHFTDIEYYGGPMLNLQLSSLNTFTRLTNSENMFSYCNYYTALHKCTYDPNTGADMVDGTKYYFKSRTFYTRDRVQYTQSRTYSATPFLGSTNFPDYISCYCNATSSVTFGWTHRVPMYTEEWGKQMIEIYRGTSPGFALNSSSKIMGLNTAAVLSIPTVTVWATNARTLTFNSDKTITASSGSFITDGFSVGDKVTALGTTDCLNNKTFTINNVTATVLTVDEAVVTQPTYSQNVRIIAKDIPALQYMLDSTDARTLKFDHIVAAASSGRTFSFTSSRTITCSSGTFVGDGFAVGDKVMVSGTTSNNTTPDSVTVTVVAAGTLTFNETFVVENASETAILIVDKLTASSGSFITDGYAVGDMITCIGSTDGDNDNKTFTVQGVTALVLNFIEAVTTQAAYNTASQITIYNKKIANAKFVSLNATKGRSYTFVNISKTASDTRLFTFSVLKTISATGSAPGSFSTDGFVIGDKIKVTGTTLNNSTFTITAVATTMLTVSEMMFDEGPFAADVTLVTNKITCTSSSVPTFLTDPWIIGDKAVVTGSTGGVNDGTFTVTNVVAATMNVAETITNEATPYTSGLNITAIKQLPHQVIYTTPARTFSISASTYMTISSGNIFQDGYIVGDCVKLSGTIYNNVIWNITTLTAVRVTVSQPRVAEVIGTNPIVWTHTGAKPTLTTSLVRTLKWDNSAKTITLAGTTPGSFITDNYLVNDRLFVTGTVANNGWYTITDVAATVLTLSEPIIADAVTYAATAGSIATITAYHAVQKATITASAGRTLTFSVAKTITASSGSFILDGYLAGDVITIANTTGGLNDGKFTIAAIVNATLMTVCEPMYTQAAQDSLVTITPISLNNDTTYYYKLRKYDTTGVYHDSAEFEVTPTEQQMNMNLCTRGSTFATTWTASGITVGAASRVSPFLSPSATQTAEALLLTSTTSPGTLTQSVPTAVGQAYVFTLYYCTNPTALLPTVSGSISLGTTTTAFTATGEWQQVSASFTATGTTTNAVIRLTTTAQTIVAWAPTITKDTAKPYIATTASLPVVNANEVRDITVLRSWCRAYGDAPTHSGIEFTLGGAVTGELWTEVYCGTTADFVPDLSNCIFRTWQGSGAPIAFNNFSSDNVVNTFTQVGRGVPAAYWLLYLAGSSSRNKILNVTYDLGGAYMAGLVSFNTQSNDTYMHNWIINNFRNYFVASASLQLFAQAANTFSGVTVQNLIMNNSDFAMLNIGSNMIFKGVSGGNAKALNAAQFYNPPISPDWILGNTVDSISIAYAQVYDTIFHELYFTSTTGALHIAFNASSKDVKPYTLTGTAFFDNTGKLYLQTAGDSVTYEWPHKIIGVTGFRNLKFKLNGLSTQALGNSADYLEGLKIEYAIKTTGDYGSFNLATPATLSALTLPSASEGFYLKIKITAMPGMKYALQYKNFVVGEQIRGIVSGATGYVEADFDLITQGTIWLDPERISGTFVPGEAIVRHSDGEVRATNVATNTSWALFPSFTSYIDALQIYTTVDQNAKYPASVVTITLTNIVPGSMFYIFNSDTNAEIAKGTATGTPAPGEDTIDYSVSVVRDADFPITVNVRKSSAPVKYLPFETGSTVTANGADVFIAQIFDTVVIDLYPGISTDFTVNTALKTIKHTSGTDVYTVKQFYSWLLDYFDELGFLDDQMPIAASTPTEYNLINGWFIDDPSFKFLTGGAITSIGHASEIQVLKLDNITNDPVGSDIGKQVKDDGVEVGKLIHYEIDNYGDNTGKWYVRTGSGTAIANNSAITITSGTGAGSASADSLDGESIWSNIFTLGSLVSSTTLDVYQNDIQIIPWWTTGHIDILVKVKEAGVEIDSGNLTIFARKYGSLYDHFVIDASSGRNPVPLAAFNDGNNQTSSAVVAAYTGFTFTFGHTSKDMANGSGSRPYDCIIECNYHTIAEIYEYLKYVTRSGSTTSLNGADGEFYTGVGDIYFAYNTELNGPFVEGEIINGTAGIYGTLTSLIDNGTDGIMVLRHVHGTFANDMSLTGVTSSATALVDGSVDSITPQKQAPFGSLAGGQFFGARGVWLDHVSVSDANNYQLIDSTGTTQAPPSSIYITVNGLEIGDVVSVFRTTGNNKIIDKTYLTSHSSANTSGSTTFTTVQDIPADTPETGVIRIVDTADNSEKRYSYTSYAGKVFSGITKLFGTLDAGLDQNYDGTDTAYVPYIDVVADSSTVSVAITFSETRYIYSNVRHKGIVPFDVKGTITSTGYSLTAIRTTDSIVS